MELSTYPTLPMLEMMKKRDALNKDTPQAEKDSFWQQYVVPTHLKRRESIIVIEAIFIQHKYLSDSSITVRDKMKQLECLPERLGEEMKWIAEFYCRLMDQWESGKYVFYALTESKEDSEPFDLQETPDKAKFITTKACNTCQKNDCPLEICAKCHRAAYCNKECQTKDWKFHKHFCTILNTK